MVEQGEALRVAAPTAARFIVHLGRDAAPKRGELMRILGIVTAAIGAVAVLFVVFTAVVKWFWAWTVPSLFPGAVAQGLVVGSVSWGTAAKVALGVAILAGGARGGSSGEKASATG